MALLWVLFGDRCDYFINLNKIHAVMDLPEVQQLRQKFPPEICRRISWAIIDDGRSFFNTVLTQQDFDGRGALSFPQSFQTGVLESVRFCNPIQRGNFPIEWMVQPRSNRIHQQPRGTDTQALAGGGAGGARGGEPLVAVDLDGRAEAEVEANKNGRTTATVDHILVALVAGAGNGGAPLLPTHVTQRLRL
jgi:hypothetical protein